MGQDKPLSVSVVFAFVNPGLMGKNFQLSLSLLTAQLLMQTLI